MPVDPVRLKDVFNQALAHADSADRAACLEAACGGDAELRSRVEALLRASEEPDSLLGPPAAPKRSDAMNTFDPEAPDPAARATGYFRADEATGTSGDDSSALRESDTRSGSGGEASSWGLRVGHENTDGVLTGETRLGQVIAGRYTLVEVIGEGGMGSVYRAAQTEPVKRQVALKLIKSGMDSRQVLARFEAERQALALMDHPNIAKVLDGGLHDQRPFFVMELVKGIPITGYCDRCKLTPKGRLELFVQVCQAIQHAHQKGIIHRDIKPSNVLIALYDDKPVVKVIDFGVAKATGGALTERSIHTSFGGVVGTPQYMSPEQATFDNLDIDTRSDVYALGVLLYELLTGSPPFSRKDLENKGLLEILRVVREEEPPRPSTKLSTADALPTLSANRSTQPKQLTGLLRNELDWIVMKALEKDRTRRYDTANGLARDIQRYLADEVVEARPPSTGYRLRKAYRKNRAAVLGAVGSVLLTWIAASTIYFAYRRAVFAEGDARESARVAVDEREKADTARGVADEMRIKAERAAASAEIDVIRETRDRNPLLSLLRMARIATQIPSDCQALREFAVVATLVWGQDYTSFHAPITHDGYAVNGYALSGDGRKRLTYGEDKSVRLWECQSGRLTRVLSQDVEPITDVGFLSDESAYTDHTDGVLRVWNTTTGAMRSSTSPLLGQYRARRLREQGARDGRPLVGSRSFGGYRETPLQVPDTCYVEYWSSDRDRLLTWSEAKNTQTGKTVVGSVRLWDTATGRVIADLNQRNHYAERPDFSWGGRWLFSVEGSVVRVLSLHDGRTQAVLDHSPAVGIAIQGVSPGEKWLLIRTRPTDGEVNSILRVWDTGTWRSADGVLPIALGSDGVHFLTDSLFAYYSSVRDGHRASIFDLGRRDTVFRGAEPYRHENDPARASSFRLAGDRLHDGSGRVFDTSTWQLLPPPKGRRFHPDIAQFAPDGRFLPVDEQFSTCDRDAIGLFDTRTEKMLYTAKGQGMGWTKYPFGIVREWGDWKDRGPGPEVIDVTSRGNIPPDLVQHWAQVAVCGELGPDGEFVSWDEPTWEKKRQELAAVKPPYPDFPFPGHLASDRLHWLRAEYQKSTYHPALLTELLRRAEASGGVEAVRWRAERATHFPQVAPPPREKK